MIIDAHQHFWQFDPVRDAWITEEMQTIRKDFLPEDLKPVLEKNGVDGCVAVQADQSETETDFLLQLANENDFIKGVVGWADLRGADIKSRLEHYSKFPLLKGFRHIVQGEPDKNFLLRDDFGNGIKALAEYDFTYDILVYPHQLPAVGEFVKKFHEQPLVIDHLAKPDFETGELKSWEQHIRNIARYKNVYCKLSGMVTEADLQNWEYEDFVPFLEVALEAFGPDRLMFGSDWPVCLLAAEYEEVIGIVRQFVGKLSASEQTQIMGGNAAEFYKLK
ncbi:amidohydrolase family protein [Chitinophaga sp. GCM10012297]|uniref:Amidohydrolase family protein n=1 Tax=Chitinophaga chungangae TaxID=2821488 RepID=A0ABS3YL11_9BACT|nr:amidohydrolase family protein [Chitinophaga chungangae]MBO9155373.1 amidohydrolase family protein [Chitinophaga chungangae]